MTEIDKSDDCWNHPDNPWPKIERMERALRSLLYGARVNQEQDGLAMNWREVEAICKQGLGNSQTDRAEQAALCEFRKSTCPPNVGIAKIIDTDPAKSMNVIVRQHRNGRITFHNADEEKTNDRD